MRYTSSSAPTLDFVVLGAQKSASTYLQGCLAEHPQIVMPRGESRHFEDPLYSEEAVCAFITSLRRAGPSARTGIKRPDYLARPEVPSRIAHHAPAARLLAILREPVSRAVSAYYHYVQLGFAPLLPLDDAFSRILDGSIQSRFPRVAEVVEYGMYGKHVSRYLEHFPRSQLFVMLHEDVLKDPRRQLADVFRFLGVEDSFSPRQIDHRPNSSVHAAWRLSLLRSRNRWLFRYAPDLSRREPRRLLGAGRLYGGAVSTVDRLLLTHLDHSSAPVFSERTDERLRELYSTDLKVLERILGRDLSAWGIRR